MDEYVPRKRATSADVARASGVSRATVSYVLNQAPNKQISQATKDLVLETARRLGHVPNPQARALKRGSSNVVLGLVPALTLGFIFDRSLDALTRTLAEQGYAFFVHRMTDDLDSDSVQDLWRYLTPALIVTVGNFQPHETAALAERAPSAVVSDFGAIDHHRIGALQARHLIDTGHRRLGFVMPVEVSLARYARGRCEGATDICRQEGLPEPTVHLLDSTLENARAIVRSFHEAGITGVCAHNDDVALLLLEALSAEGEKAPGDLAVIGSDDIPLAQLQLSTVALKAEVYAADITHRVLTALGAPSERSENGEMLKLVRRQSS